MVIFWTHAGESGTTLSKGERMFVGLQTSVWVGDAGCLLTR